MTKVTDRVTAEQKLVDDLIELLEKGETPWRKPWNGEQGRHRNLITGHEYRGSNPIFLELGSIMRGSTYPLWIGSSQAKTKGWFPKKGSKAIRIVRPQLNKIEEEVNGNVEARSWVSYKIVPIFNVIDLCGGSEEATAELEQAIAAALAQDAPEAPPQARLEAAEAVLEAWTVPTIFGGARACYSPLLDQINMPIADVFKSREGYCSTWAHEQAHSTGHKDRLARPMDASNETAYAREELVAELASILICYRLQIGCELENHAAYLRSWASMLREKGSKALMGAMGDARKAADLIAPEEEAAEAA